MMALTATGLLTTGATTAHAATFGGTLQDWTGQPARALYVVSVGAAISMTGRQTTTTYFATPNSPLRSTGPRMHTPHCLPGTTRVSSAQYTLSPAPSTNTVAYRIV
ncbi:hypothetical protein ABZ766_13660 [Streptomyces sp. NPDC006670]|uniref:hypothetical protein n=1 Tax=Streptomyces sp. NPDC006670 TaxID=3154476 RepID=UPI0033FD3EB2